MKKIIIAFILALFFVGGTSSLVLAQENAPQNNKLELRGRSDDATKNARYDDIFLDNKIAKNLEDRGVDEQNWLKDVLKDIFQGSLIRLANVVLGVVAILYLVITGVRLVTTQGNEESIKTAQKHIGFVILGLMVISLAQFLAFDIFNPVRESNGGYVDVLGNANSNALYDKVLEIKVFFQILAGAILTLSLVISGYRLVTSRGKDDFLQKEKAFIYNFTFGVILIIAAEGLVRGAFGLRAADGSLSSEETANRLIAELASFVNFTLSLISIVAVLMLIIASLYYVISLGDEERANRAKRVIFSSVLAIIIAISAYSIARFFI